MMYKSACVALLATSVLGLKMQDPAPGVAPPPAAPEPQAADFSIPGMPAAAQAPAAPALPAEAAPALPAEAPPAPELAASATNPPVAAAVTETSAPAAEQAPAVPDMSQAWAAATPSPEMQQAWTNAMGGGAQTAAAAMPTGDWSSIAASPEVEATIRQTRQGLWDETVKAMDGRMGKRIQKKIAQSYQNPDSHGDISEEDDPNREWHEKAKDNMVDSMWKFGRSMFPAMVGAYQQGAPTIARVASDMANMQAAR